MNPIKRMLVSSLIILAPTAPVIYAAHESHKQTVSEIAEVMTEPPSIPLVLLPTPSIPSAQIPAQNSPQPKIIKKKGIAPIPSVSGTEQWRSEVAKYDWSVPMALAIMRCESGGNPNAKSSTNDQGLFQIHNGFKLYGNDIYKAEFNIAIAYKFYYLQRGWNPWSTYKNGCYKQFL